MRVFYRDRDKTLHCINSSSETVEECRNDVMEYLHETKEHFFLPLLVEIVGGKG